MSATRLNEVGDPMKQSDSISTLSEETINDIVRRLVSALSPRAIYLFGSHARGVPHQDSDVDVMVILEEQRATVEHHQLGYSCLRGTGMPVELHVCTSKRFERFADVIGSIEREVHRKGVLIYAAEA